MKHILLIFTLAILISCQNQRDTYLIKGNVKEIPDSTIIDLYVMQNETGQRICSDTIINGQFQFSDTLDTCPTKMILMMKDFENYLGSCDLWVDHEVIEITGTGKYLASWLPSGNNKELNTFNRLRKQTRKLSVTTDSLFVVRKNNRKNTALIKQIDRSIDSIQQIRNKIEFDLIKENPNSQSALELLYLIAASNTAISKREIRAVYDKMDSTYQNTIYGESILGIIGNKQILKIGDEIENFMAYDTEGEKHNLLEFKGKYILLDFWSSACGSCRKAIPETRKLHSNNMGIIEVIGVNMDTNKDLWRKTSKKESISWINLSDGKGTSSEVLSIYGIKGFPSYVLISPEGEIIEKWMGYWPNVYKEKIGKHIEGLMM